MTASRPLTVAPGAEWPEFAHLASRLSVQLDLCRVLEECLATLGDAVRRRDVADVARVVDEQERVAGRLASVAAQVRTDVGALAARLGLERSATIAETLSRLTEVGMPDGAALIAENVEEIRKVSDTCAKGNEQNAALLRQALAYTNFTLRLLTAAGTAAGYTDTGERQLSPRRLVDTHA